jgi:hypothetical protein
MLLKNREIAHDILSFPHLDALLRWSLSEPLME